MEALLKVSRRWGAPAAAVLFFTLWCVAEAGRMGPGLHTWPGTWPLILMTAAIALAAWKPYASLGFTAGLLAGQLGHTLPAMYDNDWAIYLGSFISLGFIQWTAGRRTRLIAAGANVAFAGVMTVLMLSWRYSDGLGWYAPAFAGDRYTFRQYGWQLFALLTVIAGACAAVGLLLAMYQERGSLFRARSMAQTSLREAEVDLIVEQERTRIARDLHDVLAHSLAVIAAQADGTRYLSKDQPKAVLKALENISTSARSALVDAQRVIEGVHDDGAVTPQPRLNDVGPLVAGMQGSLAIERSESGVPVELSAGQQLAVFRIIQECLTNALKHGGRGTAVRLHLDWSGPGLTLHVASGIPAAADSTDHSVSTDRAETRVGRGLAGMRERAHLAGGWMTAGPDGEQYRVTVFIPYGTMIDGRMIDGRMIDGTMIDGRMIADAAVNSAEPGLVPVGSPAALPDVSLKEAGDRG